MLLPDYDGKIEQYQLRGTPLVPHAPKVAFTRRALAAAHVVSDPIAERDPWQEGCAVDWDATLKFRAYLWEQGLDLAEAMDTAQRGMGVGWPIAKELIQRSLRDAAAHPQKPRVACGAGTDHKQSESLRTIDDVIDAYTTQMEVIEAAGGQCIIMASRALPAIAAKPADYQRVYDTLISQARQPVILHWLGPMFDPALAGYWGSEDLHQAAAAVLTIIKQHADKIDGIKVSLLEPRHEIDLRRLLPDSVRLYTGDDFNYVQLIKGDGKYHSDALLGVFAAIAPAASQALEMLAADDIAGYDALLEPTVSLAREIFKSPTRYYKAGIAFMAWLNGLQRHFVMPAGMQSAREIAHYAEVFRLADQARLLVEPELASRRMVALLKVYGIEQ